MKTMLDKVNELDVVINKIVKIIKKRDIEAVKQEFFLQKISFTNSQELYTVCRTALDRSSETIGQQYNDEILTFIDAQFDESDKVPYKETRSWVPKYD